MDGAKAPTTSLAIAAPLLDTAGLARYLSLSISAIRADLKRGKIPAKAIIKLGRRLRFDPEAIRTWLETLRKADKGEVSL